MSVLITSLHAATVCGKNVAYQGSTATKSCSDLSWLDTGDTSWQLTAATFVGLMSLPGLALLYAGLVPRKWVVNTMFMAFSGFSAVLVVWILWGTRWASDPRSGVARPIRTPTTTPEQYVVCASTRRLVNLVWRSPQAPASATSTSRWSRAPRRR